MELAVSPPSDIWVFRRENNGWCWRRTSIAGQEVAHSRTAFGSMERCMHDAARHGYVASLQNDAAHGLAGSRSSTTKPLYGDVEPQIERDGAGDDDDVEPDYPDGETP